jgi:hypothetical protein
MKLQVRVRVANPCHGDAAIFAAQRERDMVQYRERKSVVLETCGRGISQSYGFAP